MMVPVLIPAVHEALLWTTASGGVGWCQVVSDGGGWWWTNAVGCVVRTLAPNLLPSQSQSPSLHPNLTPTPTLGFQLTFSPVTEDLDSGQNSPPANRRVNGDGMTVSRRKSNSGASSSVPSSSSPSSLLL